MANKELELARQFIEGTGTHIFLTGKAGTGKTTFLRTLKAQSPKRMIVVAPTGVAAINAGGVTIHSFFQLPFSPYIPGSTFSQGKGRYSFSKEKKNILRSLDLLVIDEISMVRADLLDAIDAVLRRYKDRNKPFGGVQLLMIGDLQQLAPVIREDEIQLLGNYYSSFYFFGSNALKESNYVTIELKTVYRQTDTEFIDILNSIRERRINDRVLAKLNERYIPGFKTENADGYIRLSTHNYSAQSYNERQLNNLPDKAYHYKATIKGTFTESAYPAEETLILKRGAQVMFIKNDDSGRQRFYNGKIGHIHSLSADSIVVRCDDDGSRFAIEPMEWANSRYTLNEQSKEIQEVIEGTFRQYPLRLAWAITIHKSQGLTFEKAVIDANASFAHGQVYVALSRCKTLRGLVLATPLTATSIISDDTVDDFMNDEAEQATKAEQELAKLQYDYFYKLLNEQFSFTGLRHDFDYVVRLLEEHFYRLYPELLNRYKALTRPLHEQVALVEEKFCQQYTQLISTSPNYMQDPHLQERIKKAAEYFHKTITKLLFELLGNTEVETGNKVLRKRFDEALFNLMETFTLKKETLNHFAGNDFSTTDYLKKKAEVTLRGSDFLFKKGRGESSKGTSRPLAPNIPTDIRYPQLYRTISEWRRGKSEEMRMPAYTILQQKALICMANSLPSTMEQLIDTPYFGKKSADKYGSELLEIINDFVAEHAEEITERPIPISRKGLKKGKKSSDGAEEKAPKTDTKTQTLQLFKEGKTIREISTLRNLAISTIESHLTHFVGKGELAVEALVPKDKINRILAVLKSTSGLTEAKNALGDDYSYGEIRLVSVSGRK